MSFNELCLLLQNSSKPSWRARRSKSDMFRGNLHIQRNVAIAVGQYHTDRGIQNHVAAWQFSIKSFLSFTAAVALISRHRKVKVTRSRLQGQGCRGRSRITSNWSTKTRSIRIKKADTEQDSLCWLMCIIIIIINTYSASCGLRFKKHLDRNQGHYHIIPGRGLNLIQNVSYCFLH